MCNSILIKVALLSVKLYKSTILRCQGVVVMVFGYNERRPRKEDYEAFVDKFSKGLEQISGSMPNDELSLMLYGSYVRGDYVPGRSGIDAVLIFPDDVVTDKTATRKISKLLHEILIERNVKFNVTILDLTVMKDGRFNYFTDDCIDYFREEGKIIFGLDCREQMTCLQLKTGEESSLSYNLKEARQALLLAEHDSHADYAGFLQKFNITLDAASRCPKQILYLVDGDIRRNRFSALDELNENFPDISVETLRKIRCLYDNPEKLDRLYEHPHHVLRLQREAVTFMESVIKAYIDKFPIEDKRLSSDD